MILILAVLVVIPTARLNTSQYAFVMIFHSRLCVKLIMGSQCFSVLFGFMLGARFESLSLFVHNKQIVSWHYYNKSSEVRLSRATTVQLLVKSGHFVNTLY